MTDQPLVFVEYVNVAPANRDKKGDARLLRGCGAVLLNQAARESRRLGWNGRVGLDAKPEAFGFYAKYGFVSLGTEEGFHYMERSDRI